MYIWINLFINKGEKEKKYSFFCNQLRDKTLSFID